MRKRSKTFTVYCESLFYILHSHKLKGIKHWAGPIYEQSIGDIRSLQFYSESDAKEAIAIIKANKCKLYTKRGSAFVKGIHFEEIKY